MCKQKIFGCAKFANFFSKIKELCERLLKANSEKLKKIASTENKVKEMFKLAFDQNDLEQKEKVQFCSLKSGLPDLFSVNISNLDFKNQILRAKNFLVNARRPKIVFVL
jgi:hypothetical protein